MRPAAKKSGYGANPGKCIMAPLPRELAIMFPKRSSKVPLHALATLDVPLAKTQEKKMFKKCNKILPNMEKIPLKI